MLNDNIKKVFDEYKGFLKKLSDLAGYNVLIPKNQLTGESVEVARAKYLDAVLTNVETAMEKAKENILGRKSAPKMSCDYIVTRSVVDDVQIIEGLRRHFYEDLVKAGATNVPGQKFQEQAYEPKNPAYKARDGVLGTVDLE